MTASEPAAAAGALADELAALLVATLAGAALAGVALAGVALAGVALAGLALAGAVLAAAGTAAALVWAAAALVVAAGAVDVPADDALLRQAAAVSDSSTTPAVATTRWIRIFVSPDLTRDRVPGVPTYRQRRVTAE